MPASPPAARRADGRPRPGMGRRPIRPSTTACLPACLPALTAARPAPARTPTGTPALCSTPGVQTTAYTPHLLYTPPPSLLPAQLPALYTRATTLLPSTHHTYPTHNHLAYFLPTSLLTTIYTPGRLPTNHPMPYTGTTAHTTHPPYSPPP